MTETRSVISSPTIYRSPAVIYESEIEARAGSPIIPTQPPVSPFPPLPTPPISPISPLAPPDGD